MVRAVVTILLGWFLLASVAGLGHSLGLTIMLPATSAVLLARTAFARELTVPPGLAVALALGYLEDLHQATPIGTLTLAHGLGYLLMVWAATRLAVEGPIVRAFAAGLLACTIDLITFAELMALAEPLGIDPRALLNALPALRWHALATFLAAPSVWWLTDLVLRRPAPQRTAYTPVSWYRS
jgi:hypothetical protein